MDKNIVKKLINKAQEASLNSYSPYSNYKVGAALLTKTGEIFTGTNIENASYGATICAERTAVFKAVSEGFKEFKALAIFTKDGGFPCGNCLQVMAEFSLDIKIIIAKSTDEYKIYELSDFLPKPFVLGKK